MTGRCYVAISLNGVLREAKASVREQGTRYGVWGGEKIGKLLFGDVRAFVVDGHCFSPKTINSGVRQGSVLSPTIFLLIISDLKSNSVPYSLIRS